MIPVYVFSWRYTKVQDSEFVGVYHLIRTDNSSVQPQATQYPSLPDFQTGEIITVVLPDGEPAQLKVLGNGEYRKLTTQERNDIGKNK